MKNRQRLLSDSKITSLKTVREITSIYTIVSGKQQFETGTELMICYDPENPMYFYFMGRENELTETYYRFIMTGGIISVILLLISIIR